MSRYLFISSLYSRAWDGRLKISVQNPTQQKDGKVSFSSCQTLFFYNPCSIRELRSLVRYSVTTGLKLRQIWFITIYISFVAFSWYLHQIGGLSIGRHCHSMGSHHPRDSRRTTLHLHPRDLGLPGPTHRFYLSGRYLVDPWERRGLVIYFNWNAICQEK